LSDGPIPAVPLPAEKDVQLLHVYLLLFKSFAGIAPLKDWYSWPLFTNLTAVSSAQRACRLWPLYPQLCWL